MKVQAIETLIDYYKIGEPEELSFYSADLDAKKPHFHANTRKFCTYNKTYNRRDYYKIVFLKGEAVINYGGKMMTIEKPSLLLPSPQVPYHWDKKEESQSGYYCLFNLEFIHGHSQFDFLKNSSLFKNWSNPIFTLTEKQQARISEYFERMMELSLERYTHKDDMIRNLLGLMLHDLFLNCPHRIKENVEQGTSRIYMQFDRLLQQQFPLDSPNYPLQLKSPADFAKRLHVHVNHLNHSIKAETGKTTNSLIKEKIFQEAQLLLKYTDWDIAEVGYALGFEEPAYFNTFFKKYKQTTPLQFRKALQLDSL